MIFNIIFYRRFFRYISKLKTRAYFQNAERWTHRCFFCNIFTVSDYILPSALSIWLNITWNLKSMLDNWRHNEVKCSYKISYWLWEHPKTYFFLGSSQAYLSPPMAIAGTKLHASCDVHFPSEHEKHCQKSTQKCLQCGIGKYKCQKCLTFFTVGTFKTYTLIWQNTK